MDTQPRRTSLTLPAAIIIAGALVAVAIIWQKKPVSITPAPNANAAAVLQSPQPASSDISPVTAADHILGDPNAPVKIVEYSDPSCPFCKMFNPTMIKMSDTYGPSGKVAWVYRSFPIDKPDADGNILHKNAGHESQALECAASLGGNAKFWAYEKKLYDITPSVTQDTPQGLDRTQLPVIAKDVGLNPIDFNDCLSSGQFKDKVEAQYQDGVRAGITGTPTSFIITPKGTIIPLVGAQSLAILKSTIDTLLTDTQ